MAQGRSEDHPRIQALVPEPPIVALHRVAAPVEGGVDQGVEHAGRHVAGHGLHVVEGDDRVPRPRPGRVEGELLDLHQARPAVAAEAPGQDLPGGPVDAQAPRLESALDQVREGALVIGVTGNRQGPRGPLAQGAQRVVLGEVAALHDDAGVGDRGAQHRLDRGGVVAGPRPDPDRPAAAEQAHRAGLVAEPARIGGEGVAVDPHQREGVRRIGDEILGEFPGAFRDQAGVGAVDEDHRDARVGPAPDQPLDLAGLDRRQDRLTAWSRARRRGDP